MKRFPLRLLPLWLAAVLACGVPDFFLLPTPTPSAPVPTPVAGLPQTTLTFTVRVPPSTPTSAVIVAQLADGVRGERINVTLTATTPGVWSGSTPTSGGVIRYRYVRTGPTLAEEIDGARTPVMYRLIHVSGPTTADDLIAGWSDGVVETSLGTVRGSVRNSNTGQPALNALVSVGGVLILTDGEGGYTASNVPVGRQRVTAILRDGSLRPMQQQVDVAAGNTVGLDLSAPDPNLVSVTFVVTPPIGHDAGAVVRLIGDVAQLGDAFTVLANGTTIPGLRAVPLYPLGDGRYAAALQVYEGTLIRYAYTLGDGLWSGELDGNGNRRLREYVVPWTNDTRNDVVVSWQTQSAAPVVFQVDVPADTPLGDTVTIQFFTGVWQPPVPMWPVSAQRWKFTLSNPTVQTGPIYYRFCRNGACGSGDDSATPGADPRNRAFSFGLLPQSVNASVNAWRWWATPPPVATDLPRPPARPEFWTGVSLADSWRPTQPLAGEPLAEAVAGLGSTHLTLMRRSTLANLLVPTYADDLRLSVSPEDLVTVSTAARERGVQTVLHPVTCDYTPYGACDYWNGAPYSPAWWDAWFNAYTRHLLTQADLATRMNAAALIIGDYKLRPAFAGEPEAPANADARWRLLISQVRARFRGQIGFTLLLGTGVWPNPPQFLDAVDFIRLETWTPLGVNNAATLNDLAFAAVNVLDSQVRPLGGRFRRQIQLSLNALSVDGAVTQCPPNPAGGCQAVTDFAPGLPNDPPTALDLNEQATMYTAWLFAVQSRPYVYGLTAAGYNPVVALRDKSTSIRGKPTESVLRVWFLSLR
jgi:hypothetical protein